MLWAWTVRDVLQLMRERWLKKRLPVMKQVTLNQRKIFIVPAKLSLGMLTLVLLLFVLAANFQNSLVYAVCFWLLALMVINILHTYRNLSGLSITAVAVEPCFAGDNATLELALSRPLNQKKYAISIGWPGQDMAEINLDTQQATRVKLSHPTTQRGRFTLPRLDVRTYYPTRLAVAWSYLSFDIEGIVYPSPKANTSTNQTEAAHPDSEDGVEIPRGSSDFGGIREYQIGDTPRHIHWSKYATTGELHTKTFVDYASHERWLDWESLSFPGIEARLSHLCSRVLDCHSKQQQYGLRIPGTRIEPGTGEAHKTRCLTALALYGNEQ